MGSLPVGSVGRSPWPGSVDLESSVDPSKQTPKVGPLVGQEVMEQSRILLQPQLPQQQLQ